MKPFVDTRSLILFATLALSSACDSKSAQKEPATSAASATSAETTQAPAATASAAKSGDKPDEANKDDKKGGW